MDFDDEQSGGRRPRQGDPVPPDDWARLTNGAGLEAIYAARQPALTRYLRRRAPLQDVGDLVQECFRRLVARKRHVPGAVDEPGAYLIGIAHNIVVDRARAAETRQHTIVSTNRMSPAPRMLRSRRAIRCAASNARSRD